MRENIYFYFMHTHTLFILSLVLLWFNTTIATSFAHQELSAAAVGAAHTCIDKERQALLDFKAHLQDPDDLLSTWRREEDDCCQWLGVTCNNQTGHVTMLDLSQLSDDSMLEGKITLSFTYPYHLPLLGNISKFICSMTHLTFLSLSWNDFIGTIPESIGNMTQLTHLDLYGNNFSGTIPISIGSLTQLTYLNLGENQFTGTIPRSISSLTNLKKLWLGGNSFTGTIPESVGSFTNLTFLDISENNFSGFIPRSIGSLTELTNLYLEGNNFDGTIPRSIGFLAKLKSLYLSDNSFYGIIPTEFGNLTNLESLSLTNLRSFTVENLDWLSPLVSLKYLFVDGISLAKVNNWVNVIIGLQNLEQLSLTGCDLSKVMHPYSPSVNSSSSIYYIYLDNNNLNSSMFRWLCPLIGNKLEYLDISRNTFDEKISNFLNNLSGCTSVSTTLDILDASSSQFTGSLSDKIQNFSSLTYLNLASNKLDGTISEKLWQLPGLHKLDLSSNSLRGAISENIGKSNLFYIDLSNNLLEGAPSSDDVSNLSMTVDYIDVSSNKLGPRYPKWIQKLKHLMYLDLSNNNFSDTIPTDNQNHWRSPQLNYLDLSFNGFYGPIPTFSGSLSYLDLSGNKFQGGISILCQINEKLEFLDLSRNSLTGQLPDSLKNLTYLKVLNLGHNTLLGSIPPSVGSLTQLETLHLYNNNFYGGLPLSLKNCTELSLLDLGANNLYGNIPFWIGKNLSRLYALSLKSNHFFGTIPSQICQLVSLQILDLSFNKLHGTIPSCVYNLTSLVQKELFSDQNVHHYLSSVYWKTNSGTYADDLDNSYIDHLMIEWQGKINEFSSNLGFVKSIDLSSNSLTGQIPYEITDLQGLVVLNLSHNNLLGEIPKDIGQMKELQTLDLSKNNLSGELPSSMSQLNFLNFLDVSHNNLGGRIPYGTQLQTFEPVRYIGNERLCGSPLPKKCPGDEELEEPHSIDKSEGEEEGIDKWFCIGGASGFATGFWIVCSAILLNRRGRHAFFRFHDSLKDWAYVKVVVLITKWQRVARA